MVLVGDRLPGGTRTGNVSIASHSALPTTSLPHPLLTASTELPKAPGNPIPGDTAQGRVPLCSAPGATGPAVQVPGAVAVTGARSSGPTAPLGTQQRPQHPSWHDAVRHWATLASSPGIHPPRASPSSPWVSGQSGVCWVPQVGLQGGRGSGGGVPRPYRMLWSPRAWGDVQS